MKEQVLLHWHRIRDDAKGAWETWNEAPGSGDCAFCQELGCSRCPIPKASGQDHCLGTPYNEAQNAWVDYKNSGWDESQREWWELKADAMIKFLEGLPDES